MDNARLALTHAGGLAAEAILEKLPESGLAPDSVVLLGDESVVGNRLAYADSFIEIQSQPDFDFSDCSLVLMPEYDASVESRVRSLDTVLVSHTVEPDSAAIYASSPQADIKLSYTQAAVRPVNAELSCLLGVLPAIDQAFGVSAINLVFLRTAEARGREAINELAGQAVELLNGREVTAQIYPSQIAFNLLPTDNIPGFDQDLATFIGTDKHQCHHQLVEVSAFHGFAAAVQLELTRDADITSCQAMLNDLPDVHLKELEASVISDCNQSFSCVINRLKMPRKSTRNLQFWMLADPMRYGLAKNYVNISDILLKSFL